MSMVRYRRSQVSATTADGTGVIYEASTTALTMLEALNYGRPIAPGMRSLGDRRM